MVATPPFRERSACRYALFRIQHDGAAQGAPRSERPALDVDDMLRSLRLPVLVTHGAEDKNSNLIAAEYTAKMIPGAKLSVYQGVGHSPFFEATPRFNAELAAFVRSAQKGN